MAFLDTVNGTNVVAALYTAGLAILAIVYVGFNRLSAIPLIVSLFNCLGNFLGYWNWMPDESRMSGTSLFFVYIGFFTGELVLVMYGYFIVEPLLPPHGSIGLITRKMFMWIFWPLQIIHLFLRAGAIIYVMVEYGINHNSDVGEPIYDLVQAQFICLAVIECFTAYMLINIFRISRKTSIRFLGGKRLGLIKHMILSTEIRVASLAGLAIMRASLEQPKRHSKIAGQFDTIMVDLLNLFPTLLVMDVILRKAIKLEVDLQGRIESCMCSEVNKDLIPAVNSLDRKASGTIEIVKETSLTMSA